MKRIFAGVLAIALLLSLAACGGGGGSTPSGSGAASGSGASGASTSGSGQSAGSSASSADGSGEGGGGIQVEKELFDVVITLPASMTDEGTTQEQLDQEAKEKGIHSITLNADGSQTWVMSRSQHNAMMDALREELDSQLADLGDSEDYPNVASVTAKDNYSFYTVTLHEDDIGLDESFLTLYFLTTAGMYYVFDGEEVPEIRVEYVSETSGDVLRTWSSNDLPSDDDSSSASTGADSSASASAG